MDSNQNVLIADSDNDVIRRYSPRGDQVVRVAGTGTRGAAFNPDPLQVELHQPHGVNVDRKGTVYICDSYNGRVLKLE
jgi:hypothetical protein